MNPYIIITNKATNKPIGFLTKYKLYRHLPSLHNMSEVLLSCVYAFTQKMSKLKSI